MRRKHNSSGEKRYRILNTTKGEYLSPEVFGRNEKQLKGFLLDGGGIMFALAALLCQSNGRGDGEIDSSHPIIGSWTGGRIEIRPIERQETDCLEDVSCEALEAILEDGYERKDHIQTVWGTPKRSPARRAMRRLGIRIPRGTKTEP